MFAPMLSSGADVSSTSTNAILNSRPPPEEIPPLRPPHAEIPPTFWEQHGWSVGIGSVVLVTLAGAALWQLLRPRPEPVVPPEVQARRALEQMRHEAETGAQLSRISQVLRRYVAAAFDLPPEELTTTEFCAALAAKTQIGSELSSALGQFLREGDERKFAPSASPGGFNAATRALELVARAEARRAQLRQAALAAEAPLSKSQ
jgi:hypothetical protein